MRSSGTARPRPLEIPRTHDVDFLPADEGLGALTRNRPEVFRRRGIQTLLGRAPHDAGRDRMLGAALERRGKPQDLVFVEGSEPDDVGDTETAFRQCPGLVEDDGLERPRPLERRALPNEKAAS